MPTCTQRGTHLLALVLAVILIALLSACDGGSDDPVDPGNDNDSEVEQTIAEMVGEDENFATLFEALQQVGFDASLSDTTETFTVFAPDETAFSFLDPSVLLDQDEALSSVVGYHIIASQAILTADLENGEATVETLSGDEFTVQVTESGVFIEEAEVIQTDVEAVNGVIHVIDRPLLGNQDLANVTWFVSETAELYGTVVDFELRDAFEEAGTWTVFGPNNATLEEADLSDFSEEEIQQILQYHVLGGQPTNSSTLLELLEEEGTPSFETVQGEELTITLDEEEIVFNEGQATLDVENLDYVASNGILHVIEGLLLPPSFTEEDDDEEEAEQVAITLDNDGASAYFATEVEGADADDIVELNENNAPIILEVGTRYSLEIVNGGAHPFAIDDGDGTELLTHDGEGAFANDEAVNLETDGSGGFSFTLTEELSNELGEYFCVVHSGAMRGELQLAQ